MKTSLDADRKAMQQIDFIGNLDEDGNTSIFFVTEEAKETVVYFLQATVRVL